MNISWLTLRDLEYLVSVADHAHFGKAAASCHVSQPALSAQIRKVEGVVGLQIFERSNRRVVITPRGHTVVEQARVVLEEARKIGEISDTVQRPLTGSLRLGAIATVGPYLMPHLLAPLRKAYPNLDLFLREGLTEPLLGALKAGQLDAVIASDTFTDSTIRVIPLYFEPFLLAAPPDHPLSSKSRIGRRDLHSDEMVLLEDGHCLRDQTLDICPANRRGHIRQFHATSLETLRHLVAAGSGYTLIPQLAIREDRQLKSLIRYRPFDERPIGRNVILASRSRFSRMPDIEALAEFIQEHVPDFSTELHASAQRRKRA
jgi:LysR family transcriptional regulator, hydrogen peroxide-inducible genes activator